MTLSQPEFNYVRRLVLDHSAIVLEEDKGYLVESRLLPLARREGFASISLLVQKMQAEPLQGLHHRAVEAMTTNETSFFRDFHPFEGLKRFVLPDLIARRAAERALTIWCAASSSGQEPYSLCMLIRDNFSSQRRSRNNMVIDFSGTAGQVREALHTEIHNLKVEGKRYFANMSDPADSRRFAAGGGRSRLPQQL